MINKIMNESLRMTMNKKIIFCFVLILFFLSLTSALPTTSDSPKDEWWMYGGSTGYTCNTTANAPANISNTINRTLTFTVDVDNSPVIVGDSVFIVGDSYYSSKAFELNASNISQVLANSTNNKDVTHSFTYYRGSLFYHGDSYLYQVNASNLSQTIDSEYITDAGYYATPTVYDNAVYIGDGNYFPKIRHYNASNISHILSTYTSSARIYESTPVLGDYAYGSKSTTLYQLNVSDISQVIASSACSANGIADFATVTPDFVYKSCTINSVTHTVQFNATNVSQIIANFSKGYRGYASANGFLYFGSGTTVYQLNASDISQQIANFTLATSASTVPVATHQYVFISAGSVMYQLNATNVSKQIGSYTAGSTINSDPVVAKGFLYFGSIDNKLYQLGVYSPLLTVSLSSPADNYEFDQSSENITFSCSAVDHINMTNISLYITDSSNQNFALNQTTNITGTSNSSSWILDLEEGNYTWNCLAYDSDGTSDWGNENRTLTPDITNPVVSFVSPTLQDNAFTSSTSVQINTTITEANLERLKYNWNGTNYSIYNDSLILMYNFDNLSALGENSSFAVDVSQGGHDGTIGESPDADSGATSDGKYGGAFEFDGSGDEIDLGNVPSLQITAPITLSVWFKADTYDTNKFYKLLVT